MIKIRISFILLMAIPCLIYSQELELTDTRAAQEAADTAPAFVKTWRLVEDFTTVQDFYFDTLQTNFQIFHPVYRNSISNAYLGNLGLQSRNNLYFNEDQVFPARVFYPMGCTNRNINGHSIF